MWTSTFPDRFLPSPVPLSENELSVSKPRDVKPSEKFPDLWKRMAIQSLIPKLDIQKSRMTCIAQQFKKTEKRICKACETYFPSAAAVKRHRRGDGCPGLVDVVADISENEEENEEVERQEAQPSVSNTAPILNIFGILAQMSFIDAESCDEDEDQKKNGGRPVCIREGVSSKWMLVDRGVGGQKMTYFLWTS